MFGTFTSVLVVAVLQVFFTSHGDAARILVSFPPPAGSHFILGKALATAIAARGHEVTFINSIGIKKQIKGLNEIVVNEFFEQHEKDMQHNLLEMNEKSPFGQFIHILENINTMSNDLLNHTKVQDLIKNKKFDLIILDAVLNDAHVGLGHHFDCPVIILSTMGSNLWINSYVANPAPPSYVAQVFGGSTSRMTFLERLKNTIATYLMEIVYYGYHFPKQDYLLHQYFPDAPALKEVIAKRTALILLNSHPSISPAKPSVPNMIEIGGFHVSDPKPLPQDLKNYLDNAEEGFILFSMGSIMKGTMLPQETREIIMKVFAQLPYKILWKFEDDQMPGKPDNVRIEKWLPQNDILAHPNIKLFITHGGLLSTTEAVYHGVPIVGIPIFGDQAMNMAASESLGFAKTIHFKEITYEKLLSTLRQVLRNKPYTAAAKYRSALLRDQPMKPIDSAMYWIEYVVRHKYLEHLKTGAIHLTWYQESSLDVLALIGSIIFVSVFVMFWIFKKCCKRGKTTKGQKEKKNQ